MDLEIKQNIKTEQNRKENLDYEESSVLFSCSHLLNKKDQLSKLELPFGCLFNPIGNNHELSCLRRSPLLCSRCKAVIHPYCFIDFHKSIWTCTFCGNSNSNKNTFDQSSDIEFFPELKKNEVEYLDPEAQSLGLKDYEQLSSEPTFLFLIDSNFSKQEFKQFCQYFGEVISKCPKSWSVGIITFSTVIAIYEVTNLFNASAEVFNVKGIDENHMNDVLKNSMKFFGSISDYSHNFSKILQTITSISQDSIPPNTQKRGLGQAIALALHLMKGLDITQKRWGRILIFTNGTPNYGKGEIEENTENSNYSYSVEQASSYFKNLSVYASELDIGIDVFCIGYKWFHTQILQNLVSQNGGIIIMQEEFNFNFGENLNKALHRSIGRDGTLEIKTSSSISLSHVIGSLIPLSKSKLLNGHSFKLGGIQSRLSYTFLFSLLSDIPGDFIYFQFRVNFTNLRNQRISRVITIRINLSGNMTKYLQSINTDLISILMAKQSVLQARKSNLVEQVISNLDKTLAKIAFHTGTTQDHQHKIFPNELKELPKKIFHLRRGSMLGPILQHSDDIDYVRNLFLNSNFEDCKHFIEPTLYTVEEIQNEKNLRSSFSLVPTPLEIFALQSNKILLLDYQTVILIWIGRSLDSTLVSLQKEKCMEFIKQVSKSRFPHPQVREFKEGSSMARWLQCLLIPSHKDSPEEQLASFPPLRNLTPQQIAAFIKRFPKTDDLSFQQYLQSIFNSPFYK